MFVIHIFLDGVVQVNERVEHIPSKGDLIRFPSGVHGNVTDIIYCYDEYCISGQRVDIITDYSFI